MPRPKPQNPVIDGDTLVEVARFLARAWSEKYGIELVIDEAVSVPETRLKGDGGMIIEMPPLSAFKIADPLLQYRVWRKVLWHEAMHAYFGLPKELDENAWEFDTTWAMIANAIEDYKIEEAGVRIYPGMAVEKAFADAVFLGRFNNELDVLVEEVKESYPSLPERAVRNYLIVSGFIYGVTTGEVPSGLGRHLSPEDISKIRHAVAYARAHAFSKPLGELANEVIRILGVDQVSPGTVFKKIVGLNRRRLNPIQNPYSCRPDLSDHRKDIEEMLEGKEHVLQAPREVEEEFKRIAEESEKKARLNEKVSKTEEALSKRALGRGIYEKIAVPDGHGADESKLYDPLLIAHLKDRLRAVKKRFLEVHDYTGDEIDVEEYVRKGRPFIAERLVKTGGIRVMILMDFSGSIGWEQGVSDKYKTATVALAEALNYIGAVFSIYAFNLNGSLGGSVVLRIKSAEERWSRVNARRLAGIIPNGDTPLADVYDILLPVVEKQKPHVFITMTDGMPNNVFKTAEMVKQLKRRMKMVAIAIGSEASVRDLAENLEKLGYHKSIAISNLRELPEKILRLLLDGD